MIVIQLVLSRVKTNTSFWTTVTLSAEGKPSLTYSGLLYVSSLKSALCLRRASILLYYFLFDFVSLLDARRKYRVGTKPEVISYGGFRIYLALGKHCLPESLFVSFIIWVTEQILQFSPSLAFRDVVN
jgi:hypothetical protein